MAKSPDAKTAENAASRVRVLKRAVQSINDFKIPNRKTQHGQMYENKQNQKIARIGEEVAAEKAAAKAAAKAAEKREAARKAAEDSKHARDIAALRAETDALFARSRYASSVADKAMAMVPAFAALTAAVESAVDELEESEELEEVDLSKTTPKKTPPKKSPAKKKAPPPPPKAPRKRKRAPASSSLMGGVASNLPNAKKVAKKRRAAKPRKRRVLPPLPDHVNPANNSDRVLLGNKALKIPKFIKSIDMKPSACTHKGAMWMPPKLVSYRRKAHCRKTRRGVVQQKKKKKKKK